MVGSGAAGLYAALCLPSHYRVGLISKSSLKVGASDWAQGGIAAAIAPEDSAQEHLIDTIKAGAGLCDLAAVNFLVDHAPAAIASLVEMGVAFDRQGERLAMTLEAAHSHARVLHAADTTGSAIVDTLTERVLARSNIKIIEQGLVLQLWMDPDQGHCRGLCLLYQGWVTWLSASAVILATGGGGQVFAHTTNPSVSTGDGVALAWRAGAVIQDPEFVQFHPTALMKEGAPHFLISEAVRGEGAHLIDDKGDRFAFAYDPAGELAPRDIVSRAIYSHLQKTAENPALAHVFLDLRTIKPERLRYRFPNIIKRCQQWGIDLFEQPIPVAPAAHYWMGGVKTDVMAQTSLPGLYAIGETASTGVHGANRLASNSLLECVVFAAPFAHLDMAPGCDRPSPLPLLTLDDNWQEDYQVLQKIRQALPLLVWKTAGICRSQTGLASALTQIQSYQQELSSLKLVTLLRQQHPTQSLLLTHAKANQHWRLAAETLNLIDVAHLILTSALFRTESRGGHFRLDYPQSDPHWQGHTLITSDRWHLEPNQG